MGKLAIDVVHPAVVRAHELIDIAPFLETDQRATMPADIGERPNFAVTTAHDDGGLVAGTKELEVPRLGQL